MATVLLPTRGARVATPSRPAVATTGGRRVTCMAAKGEREAEGREEHWPHAADVGPALSRCVLGSAGAPVETSLRCL
jgi:hypothetical protein